MSKMSIGIVFLGRSNFDVCVEMLTKGHFKNFSHVIDEIITHYITISGQNTKLIQKIQEQNREIFDLKQQIDNYRGQIINDAK